MNERERQRPLEPVASFAAKALEQLESPSQHETCYSGELQAKNNAQPLNTNMARRAESRKHAHIARKLSR